MAGLWKALKEEPWRVNEQDNQGNTMLHYAAWYGHLKTMKMLLKLGAQPDIVNREGRTPLHLAYSNSQMECHACLLEASILSSESRSTKVSDVSMYSTSSEVGKSTTASSPMMSYVQHHDFTPRGTAFDPVPELQIHDQRRILQRCLSAEVQGKHVEQVSSGRPQSHFQTSDVARFSSVLPVATWYLRESAATTPSSIISEDMSFPSTAASSCPGSPLTTTSKRKKLPAPITQPDALVRVPPAHQHQELESPMAPKPEKLGLSLAKQRLRDMGHFMNADAPSGPVSSQIMETTLEISTSGPDEKIDPRLAAFGKMRRDSGRWRSGPFGLRLRRVSGKA